MYPQFLEAQEDSWSGSDSEQTCLVEKSAEITNVNSDE
jgi:hypothetical protein